MLKGGRKREFCQAWAQLLKGKLAALGGLAHSPRRTLQKETKMGGETLGICTSVPSSIQSSNLVLCNTEKCSEKKKDMGVQQKWL